MSFIFILNNEIPLAKAINALSHIAIGLGHQYHGNPGLDIYFGSHDQIRKFRNIVNKFENSILSDFTNTMTGEKYVDDQLKVTRQTHEKDLIYYAISALVDSDQKEKIKDILKDCKHLENYTSIQSNSQINILPRPKIVLPKESPKFRIVMVISKKAEVYEILNPIIQTCLTIGKKANLNDLYFQDYIDADNILHYGISFHSFPILTAKTTSKHKQINDDISNADVISEKIVITKEENGIIEEQPLLTTIFGKQDILDELVPKKITSLYNKEL